MEKLKIKYAPMIVVIYFSVMGLLIAVMLSAFKSFLDGTPFFKKIDAPIFIFISAILIGLIYCEIKFWISNIWIGSILFGTLSINLFIFLLPISTLVIKGNMGDLLLLNLHLLLTLFGGALLGSIYFGIKKKNT